MSNGTWKWSADATTSILIDYAYVTSRADSKTMLTLRYLTMTPCIRTAFVFDTGLSCCTASFGMEVPSAAFGQLHLERLPNSM